MRAVNSLNRGVGAFPHEAMKSPQDRCPAVGGICGCAVLANAPALKAWLLVSMALGVAFIWAHARLSDRYRATRYNGHHAGLFPTAFLCGPVFAALLLRIARVPFCSVTFASTAAVGIFGGVRDLVIVLQGPSLSTIHSSGATGQPSRTGLRYAAIWCIAPAVCCRISCWLCPLIRRREPHTVGLLLGVVLVLAAKLLAADFYGLHMTVGGRRRYEGDPHLSGLFE
ncbi:dimethyl sulfoxide reductase anchor subunit [Salmonella enterica subsp. enterica]|nr:dimethyl sulfoxide reductase anchor subunit [Salmonella enterica subsp. enterica]